MASLVSDTGYVLERIYELLTKYRLEKLKNNITISWTPYWLEEGNLAGIMSKCIRRKSIKPYCIGDPQLRNNPNFYLLEINPYPWRQLTNYGKKHVITHETVHIIDIHTNGLFVKNGCQKSSEQLHGGDFQKIMTELGYQYTQVVPQGKYWVHGKYIKKEVV